MPRAELTPEALPHCPSREVLLSFLHGELDLTDPFEGHLETCVACQKSLDQLSQDSTLWRPLAPTPWTPDPDWLRNLQAPVETRELAPLPAIAGYRLVGFLGQGGMGVVYDGIQEKLGRRVALKTLRADKVTDELRARLRREAEAIARLNHPNIVQIYEVSEWQAPVGGAPLPYLAMERVVGTSLGHWLGGRPQAPELAAEFTEILARAIQAAHAAGIVHRDLKPSNVLVQTGAEQVVLKITDFGLAKDVEAGANLTDTGQILGTPNYMAPEQVRARADEIGPAADIYALGAMLYEMLTSRAPFVGKTPVEIFLQVISVEPVSPRRLVPSMPHDLDTICLKCLEKDPRRRYASALELAEDLQRFRRGEPIRARPVGPIARSARWCRRKPALAGLWAALVVLLVGIIAVAFWYQHDRAMRATDELTRQDEARRKRELAEQGVTDAIRQAQGILARLEAELRRPGSVASLLNDPGRWSASIDAAQASLDRAAALRVGADGPIADGLLQELQRLADQIQHDDRDRQLALKLEKIRLDRSTWTDGAFDFARALREYPDAFEQTGLCQSAGSNLNASRIEQSVIKEQLLAIVDDWTLVAASQGQKELASQLLAVTRAVDPDSSRDRIRSLYLTGDRKALEELTDQAVADEAEFSKLSPAFLHTVGHLLNLSVASRTGLGPTNQRSADWLRLAQLRHPADFWLNFELANVLLSEHPVEAAGYYRTALAVRQHSGAAWTNLGSALHRQKQPAAARQALMKAVEVEPRNSRAWTMLGFHFLEQNDLPAAVAACKNGVEFDPQTAGGWNKLGMALARQQDRSGALKAYRKAIARAPRFEGAWNNLGLALYDEGDVAGAIKAYETAIECDAQFAMPWFNLGNLLLTERKLPAAIAAYKKAIDLEPKRAVAWLHLGHAFTRGKNFPAAVDAYRKAVDIDPKYATAWAHLGFALQSNNDLAGAAAACQQAIAIDPKLALAWTNLGSVYAAQRDWPAAADAHRKALAAEPKYALAWYRLGNALHQQKDLQGAVDAFKNAVEHDPKLAHAWNNLGIIYLKLKDPAQALTALKATLEIEPKHANAWANLGQLHRTQGDFASASDAYYKAFEFGSTNTANWNNLGFALAKQNRLPPAAEAYLKAVALNPKVPNAYFGLAGVYRDQGRFADAVVWFKKGLTLSPRADHDVLLPMLHECERLLVLNARLPLVLKGDTTSPAEQLALAELCFRYKDRPADAVQLFTAAFAADKSVAKNHLTSAACAALRVSAQTPDTGAQAGLRRQALEWLRADLALGAASLQAEPSTSLLDKVSHWRTHADVASVREPQSLDRLPEAERKAWRSFWSDVERLEREWRKTP